MSSLQNSEKTHSVRREEKIVEKYGFTIHMGIHTTTRPEWVKVYKDPEGNAIAEDDLKALAEKLNGSDERQRISVDWELSGKTIDCSKVEFARFSDQEECSNLPIELLATPEGPLLGIIKKRDLGNHSDAITLIDPCAVIYDGKGKINLVCIFNVADTLTFDRVAVRNTQVPNEILLGLYPGFIMQNRMMKYQLRPIIPFAQSPELGNDAD